jgi:hypothetical protein
MNPGSHAPPVCLTLAFDGSVATLTLHHGPMNAIDDVLLNELASAFDAVAANSAISALRIRSERRVFSAGADLRLVAERLAKASGADAMKATVRRFHDVYDLLAGLPVVTIAEMEGHALGGARTRACVRHSDCFVRREAGIAGGQGRPAAGCRRHAASDSALWSRHRRADHPEWGCRERGRGRAHWSCSMGLRDGRFCAIGGRDRCEDSWSFP